MDIHRHLFPGLVLAAAAWLAHAGPARAAWTTDTTVNTGVCLAADEQVNAVACSDGAGGVIIAWEDRRAGYPNVNIYARRVDAGGNPLWAADGVVICNAPDLQSYPKIVTDGAGGAIIAWTDHRGGGSPTDVYVQRVDGNGNVLWIANGVGIAVTGPSYGAKSNVNLVSDGAGGAFCTWQDERFIVDDIFAQHIHGDGTVAWDPNGAIVCQAANQQRSPVICPDGAGGAIIAWEDERVTGGTYGIYAQRVATSGSWTANGVAVYDTGKQRLPAIASDGAGGAIIAWEDDRNPETNVYVQRVNASGSLLWAASGVAACTASGYRGDARCVSDGAGGAIVVWNDSRTSADIYAQRLTASGGYRWTSAGVALTNGGTNKLFPTVGPDGRGGALVAWHELRGTNSYDVYAQNVDSLGGVAWGAGGAAMGTSPNAQRFPSIVSDGAGGAIVAFEDRRNATDYNIYVQEINGNGVVGGGPTPTGIGAAGPRAVAQLHQNYPNPFNPRTTIAFDLDARSMVSLAVFDVRGRQVATIVESVMGAGNHTRNWNAAGLASGVYVCRLSVVPLDGTGNANAVTQTRKLILLK